MASEDRGEQTVVIHRAGSWAEAMVLRGLLESAGIASPSFAPVDPFPAGILPPDFPGVEILVRESQAEEARRIIEDYLDEQEETEEG